MTIWTHQRLAELRQRAALLVTLAANQHELPPEYRAEFERQRMAERHLGLDAGPDPTYDPVHDPHRQPPRPVDLEMEVGG